MLLAVQSNARSSVAGSCTRLNRSSNRRSGSAAAQRRSLGCIFATRDYGPSGTRPMHCHSAACLAALQPPSPPRNSCRPSPCTGLLCLSTTAAPPRPARSAVGAPIPDSELAARHREPRPGGSRGHCHSLGGGGTGLCPGGLAAGTPQTFRGMGPCTHPVRKFPPLRHTAGRAASGPHPPDSSRYQGQGRKTPVPRLPLSATLTGPAPSGSTGTSRLCRGCSHPPRHHPDQAAPSFTALLRQDGSESLSPPPE